MNYSKLIREFAAKNFYNEKKNTFSWRIVSRRRHNLDERPERIW